MDGLFLRSHISTAFDVIAISNFPYNAVVSKHTVWHVMQGASDGQRKERN